MFTFGVFRNKPDMQCSFGCSSARATLYHGSGTPFLSECRAVFCGIAPRLRTVFRRHGGSTKLLWVAVPIRPSKTAGITTQSQHGATHKQGQIKNQAKKKKKRGSELSHQHPASFWFKTTIQWYPSLARLKAHRWETQKN